jgi:phage anti-repressor protein
MDTEQGKDKVEKFTRDGKEWVDGRTLYTALGHDGRFTAWIKRRIRLMSLREKIDYLADEKSTKGRPQGGRPEKIYLLNPYAADRIISLEKAKAIRRGRTRGNYKLDEYGLPILPPPKRRGPLITPWDGFRNGGRS